ncbi:hypothetical protein JTE90_025057 [Oedothorax gibbosus]|uniref:Nucleocapsid protein n=1 Tax=Oedothorax gibbosus TaxID=931172 RepID=A0AAV6TTE3_9ARAC|nr:hypothetical protein JTE90_025057 [Oedothorax gibbosus]
MSHSQSDCLFQSLSGVPREYTNCTNSLRIQFRRRRDVPEELHVNAETLVGLNRILTAIIEKRRAALGNRPANVGTGCQHYPYLVDFIASGNNQPLIDSKKRTKGVGGIIGVQGNANLEELEELDATGVVKHGRLLLTTALAEYRRLNGNLPAGIRNRREPEMVRALLELDAMNAEGNVDNSVYRQQIGNLDIIFNFYLHCRAAGIINGANPPVNVFKRLNLTLHAIGTKIQGRAKTNMLTRAGAPISNLVNLLNVTGSKHQPPYCLNSRRVYDLVSVFGIIKYNDVRRSLITGAASPRCIIHMKISNLIAMTLVITYWELIHAAATDEDINEAEHMFHQLLLQKTSEYSNTTGKIGNLFDVQLIPNQEVQHIDRQRSIQAFLALAGLQV